MGAGLLQTRDLFEPTTGARAIRFTDTAVPGSYSVTTTVDGYSAEAATRLVRKDRVDLFVG